MDIDCVALRTVRFRVWRDVSWRVRLPADTGTAIGDARSRHLSAGSRAQPVRVAAQAEPSALRPVPVRLAKRDPHARPRVARRRARAPQGYLVGAGETHSFPVFSAAFGAYFYDDFSVSGTQNPLLGQLSIRVLDDRGRIAGVDSTDGGVQVLLDGTGLVGTVLEFNSATHHEVLQVAGPGPAIISVDPHEVPPDAWIWLKSGRQWLDFRNLQRWGASLSSDVRLPADDIGESVVLLRRHPVTQPTCTGELRRMRTRRSSPTSKASTTISSSSRAWRWNSP